MRKNLLSAFHFGSSLLVVGLRYSACSTKPTGLQVMRGQTNTGSSSNVGTSGNGTVSGAGASNTSGGMGTSTGGAGNSTAGSLGSGTAGTTPIMADAPS